MPLAWCGRLAAVLALVTALAACSAGVDPEGRQLPRGDVPSEQQGPAREGEAVTALEGDGPPYGYQLVAQNSADGLCLELRDDEDGESVGCGFEVPQRHSVGFFVHQGPDGDPRQDLVVGQTATEATAVVLEYAEGSPREYDVTAVPELGTAVFVAPVDPARTLEAVVAVADGEELERRAATGS